MSAISSSFPKVVFSKAVMYMIVKMVVSLIEDLKIENVSGTLN